MLRLSQEVEDRNSSRLARNVQSYASKSVASFVRKDRSDLKLPNAASLSANSKPLRKDSDSFLHPAVLRLRQDFEKNELNSWTTPVLDETEEDELLADPGAPLRPRAPTERYLETMSPYLEQQTFAFPDDAPDMTMREMEMEGFPHVISPETPLVEERQEILNSEIRRDSVRAALDFDALDTTQSFGMGPGSERCHEMSEDVTIDAQLSSTPSKYSDLPALAPNTCPGRITHTSMTSTALDSTSAMSRSSDGLGVERGSASMEGGEIGMSSSQLDVTSWNKESGFLAPTDTMSAIEPTRVRATNGAVPDPRHEMRLCRTDTPTIHTASGSHRPNLRTLNRLRGSFANMSRALEEAASEEPPPLTSCERQYEIVALPMPMPMTTSVSTSTFHGSSSTVLNGAATGVLHQSMVRPLVACSPPPTLLSVATTFPPSPYTPQASAATTVLHSAEKRLDSTCSSRENTPDAAGNVRPDMPWQREQGEREEQEGQRKRPAETEDQDAAPQRKRPTFLELLDSAEPTKEEKKGTVAVAVTVTQHAEAEADADAKHAGLVEAVVESAFASGSKQQEKETTGSVHITGVPYEAANELRVQNLDEKVDPVEAQVVLPASPEACDAAAEKDAPAQCEAVVQLPVACESTPSTKRPSLEETHTLEIDANAHTEPTKESLFTEDTTKRVPPLDKSLDGPTATTETAFGETRKRLRDEESDAACVVERKRVVVDREKVEVQAMEIAVAEGERSMENGGSAEEEEPKMAVEEVEAAEAVRTVETVDDTAHGPSEVVVAEVASTDNNEEEETASPVVETVLIEAKVGMESQETLLPEGQTLPLEGNTDSTAHGDLPSQNEEVHSVSVIEDKTTCKAKNEPQIMTGETTQSKGCLWFEEKMQPTENDVRMDISDVQEANVRSLIASEAVNATETEQGDTPPEVDEEAELGSIPEEEKIEQPSQEHRIEAHKEGNYVLSEEISEEDPPVLDPAVHQAMETEEYATSEAAVTGSTAEKNPAEDTNTRPSTQAVSTATTEPSDAAAVTASVVHEEDSKPSEPLESNVVAQAGTTDENETGADNDADDSGFLDLYAEAVEFPTSVASTAVRPSSAHARPIFAGSTISSLSVSQRFRRKSAVLRASITAYTTKGASSDEGSSATTDFSHSSCRSETESPPTANDDDARISAIQSQRRRVAPVKLIAAASEFHAPLSLDIPSVHTCVHASIAAANSVRMEAPSGSGGDGPAFERSSAAHAAASHCVTDAEEEPDGKENSPALDSALEEQVANIKRASAAARSFRAPRRLDEAEMRALEEKKAEKERQLARNRRKVFLSMIGMEASQSGLSPQALEHLLQMENIPEPIYQRIQKILEMQTLMQAIGADNPILGEHVSTLFQNLSRSLGADADGIDFDENDEKALEGNMDGSKGENTLPKVSPRRIKRVQLPRVLDHNAGATASTSSNSRAKRANATRGGDEESRMQEEEEHSEEEEERNRIDESTICRILASAKKKKEQQVVLPREACKVSGTLAVKASTNNKEPNARKSENEDEDAMEVSQAISEEHVRVVLEAAKARSKKKMRIPSVSVATASTTATSAITSKSKPKKGRVSSVVEDASIQDEPHDSHSSKSDTEISTESASLSASVASFSTRKSRIRMLPNAAAIATSQKTAGKTVGKAEGRSKNAPVKKASGGVIGAMSVDSELSGDDVEPLGLGSSDTESELDAEFELEQQRKKKQEEEELQKIMEIKKALQQNKARKSTTKPLPAAVLEEPKSSTPVSTAKNAPSKKPVLPSKPAAKAVRGKAGRQDALDSESDSDASFVSNSLFESDEEAKDPPLHNASDKKLGGIWSDDDFLEADLSMEEEEAPEAEAAPVKQQKPAAQNASSATVSAVKKEAVKPTTKTAISTSKGDAGLMSDDSFDLDSDSCSLSSDLDD